MAGFEDTSAASAASEKGKVRKTPIGWKAAYAACILAAVLGIASAIWFSYTLSDEAAALEWRIASLEGELSGLDGEEPVTAEEVDSQMHSAREAGEAMAKAEDMLCSRHVTESQLVETAESMRALMAPGSTGSAVPWFSPTTDTFSWQFMCDYEYTGDTLPVAWMCNVQDSEGTGRASGIAAWATAIYDSTTGLFSEVDWGTTQLGDAYVATDMTDMAG